MATPDRVFTEAEILDQFDKDYDLPKDEEDEEVAPYRFLRQWYLVKKDDPDKPVSLPGRDRRFKDYILRGQLQAESGWLAPVSVEIPLSDHQCWVVDRTHEGRGIWIEPSERPESAWYWLRDPHSEKQASLHLPTRAKLGLLSNIIDALEEEGPDRTDMDYLQSYFKLTPKQLHEHLSCSDDAEFQLHLSGCTEYLPFQEPFDYELFQEQGGLAFCREHMASSWEGFDDSRLGKAIKTMKGKHVKGWTPVQYEESAKLAEERSQREPWGEPMPNARKVRPNWYADAKMEQEQVDHSRKKMRSEDTYYDSREDEGFGVHAAKKKARRHASEVPPAAAPAPTAAPLVATIATAAPAPDAAPATVPTATTAPASPAVTASAVPPPPSFAQAETATVLQIAKRERNETLAALDEIEKLLKFAEERKQTLLDSLAESNVAAAPSREKTNVVPPSPAGAVPPRQGREEDTYEESSDHDSSVQQQQVIQSSENDILPQGDDETTTHRNCVIQ